MYLVCLEEILNFFEESNFSKVILWSSLWKNIWKNGIYKKSLISSQYVCHGSRSLFPYANSPTSKTTCKNRHLRLLRDRYWLRLPRGLARCQFFPDMGGHWCRDQTMPVSTAGMKNPLFYILHYFQTPFYECGLCGVCLVRYVCFWQFKTIFHKTQQQVRQSYINQKRWKIPKYRPFVSPLTEKYWK